MADVRLIDANALGRYLSDWQMSLPGDNRVNWNDAAYDTLDDVLDVINKAPTIDPESLRPQWISTENGFPEYEKPVLVYVTLYGGFVTIATLARDWFYKNDQSKDKWWLYMEDEGHTIGKEDVTHWMPLPEPPKEEHHDQPHL